MNIKTRMRCQLNIEQCSEQQKCEKIRSPVCFNKNTVLYSVVK